MAKSKKKTVDEIPLTGTTEVEASAFTNLPEEETKTVIGITEAERLQKSGWQLIAVTLTDAGKKYFFNPYKSFFTCWYSLTQFFILIK